MREAHAPKSGGSRRLKSLPAATSSPVSRPRRVARAGRELTHLEHLPIPQTREGFPGGMEAVFLARSLAR